MQIICKICHQPFQWHRNPGQRGGRQPTICLSAECRKLRDHLCYLKWKKNHTYTRYEQNKEKILCAICSKPFISKTKNHKYCCQECADIGQSLSFQKWVKNNPEKHKENQRKKAEERKISGRGAKSERVSYRNVPKPEIKRYCVYLVDGKKCGKVTGNNGANHLYCDYHLAKLSEMCSSEYPESVYDAEVAPIDVQSIKDGKRFGTPHQ